MIVAALAAYVGIAEAPVRLLFSVLLGYPLGWLYHALFVSGRSQTVTRQGAWPRHVYSVLTGTWLAYFAYGVDALHFLVAITVCWSILRLMGPTKLAAGLVFVFVFAYLLVGYHFYASQDYSIDFTTSFCVLTLRMIGFGMDYYDGRKGKGKDSHSTHQKHPIITWDNAQLPNLPSLLETLSYGMFFGGFIAGPQFPFTVYNKFVTLESFAINDGKAKAADIRVPNKGWRVLKCFLLGAAYMAAYQSGQIYFPTSFVITKPFASLPIWHKILYTGIAGRVVLAKYLGIWTLGEGSAILCGISFNGFAHSDKEHTTPLWNGLANVNPYIYETLTSLNQVITSFNMNTNLWSKNYIFKRLRFLGNKNLSALGALLFLAIWHGFAFGYFGAFLLEFLDMMCERNLREWFRPVWGRYYDEGKSSTSSMIMRSCWNLVFYGLTVTTLGVGAVTFDLLTWERVSKFWLAINYYNHIGIFIILVVGAVLPAPKKETGVHHKKQQ